MTVAALYVDPRGPYASMPGVDAWDEARDARLYTGPYAVVAHPPCGPWGKLAHMCKRAADKELFVYALAVAQLYGGVIEHPAFSKAWAAFDLPAPGAPADAFGGRTIEVEQVEWGHVARKRTWLYLVRVPEGAIETPPFPGRTPTHWVCGGRAQPGKRASQCAAAHGVKICSAEQRRRTPPLFAEYLVRLAVSVPACMGGPA